MSRLNSVGVVFFCVLAAVIAVFSSTPPQERTVLVESAREHLYEIVSRYHKLWKAIKKTFPAVELNRREKISDILALKDSLKYLDVNFFNESKVREIAEGAKEFNIPGFRENRKLVASVDGGLHNPSVLVFDSSWGIKDGKHDVSKFNYPLLYDVKRPDTEYDIAFMTILELGALIKSKQITSNELTTIFLRRLKSLEILRKRPNNSCVDLIINNHPLRLKVQRTNGFIISISLISVIIPLLRSMSRIMKHQRVPCLTTLYKPIHRHPNIFNEFLGILLRDCFARSKVGVM